MPRKRLTLVGLIAVVCGWLVGCGADGQVTPRSAEATPSASGSPATGAGFLHVLAAMRLTTYRVDASGHLLGTADQPMPDAHQITGDPQGRFVYMAYGPRNDRSNQLRSIVVYSPDQHDGSLTVVSEATSSAGGYPSPDVFAWISLTAGVDRVYGVWLDRTYHDDDYELVVHPVASDGRLGRLQGGAFDHDSGGNGSGDVHGVVDVRSRVFYKEGTTGLAAWAIGPDGLMTQMGGTRRCVSRVFGVGEPLVAVRGFLFARTYPDYFYGETGPDRVCSYEGARLAPRQNLGFSAGTAAGLDPLVDHEPARVAFPVTVPATSGHPTRYELRVFTLAADGSPQLQDTLQTPDEVGQVLFHPSGRFLFASVGTALWVYALDGDGHLAKVDELPGGAGRMAATSRWDERPGR